MVTYPRAVYVIKRIDEFVSNGWFILFGIVVLLLLLVGGIPGANQMGVDVFYKVYPVAHDFKPSSVWVEGKDGFVTGHLRKRHGCEFRGTGATVVGTGASLPVHSLSATSRTSWPPDNQYRPIGPWLITGAAGLTVELNQHHECGNQDVFSVLGRVKFPPPAEEAPVKAAP